MVVMVTSTDNYMMVCSVLWFRYSSGIARARGLVIKPDFVMRGLVVGHVGAGASQKRGHKLSCRKVKVDEDGKSEQHI